MTRSQLIRYADVKPSPWANGGGTTRELLRSEEAGWRISLADIDRAGAFSAFPGRDRLLTVVEGEVLVLHVDGAEQVVEAGRPFAFSGDAEVEAALPEGPAKALNLIAERGHLLAATVLELSRSSRLPLAGDQAAFVVKGHIETDDASAGQFDLVSGPAELGGRSRVVVVTIQPG